MHTHTHTIKLSPRWSFQKLLTDTLLASPITCNRYKQKSAQRHTQTIIQSLSGRFPSVCAHSNSVPDLGVFCHSGSGSNPSPLMPPLSVFFFYFCFKSFCAQSINNLQQVSLLFCFFFCFSSLSSLCLSYILSVPVLPCISFSFFASSMNSVFSQSIRE